VKKWGWRRKMDKPLNHLQQLFKDSLISDNQNFLSEIEEGGKISPEKRLHIYAHAYNARLREVLLDDYPVLHEMLGDDNFDFLCDEYIKEHPSNHPSLRFFGQHLEVFLTENEPFSEEGVFAEMARFEWALRDVFDGADAETVVLEDLGAVPPELWTTLRFKLHPTYKIISLKWNILDIWRSVKEEGDEFTPHDKLADEISVLLWRDGLVTRFRSVSGDETAALKFVSDFKAFPDVCENLAHFHGDEAPGKAVQYLQEWVVSGLITGLDYVKLS
jgi:hypothetical protein